jgi:hypothetical protein
MSTIFVNNGWKEHGYFVRMVGKRPLLTTDAINARQFVSPTAASEYIDAREWRHTTGIVIGQITAFVSS